MPITTKEKSIAAPRLFQKQATIPLLLYYWRYFDIDDLTRCFPTTFNNDDLARDYTQRWRAAGFIKSAKPGYQYQQHLHTVTVKTTDFLTNHFNYPFVATPDNAIKPFTIEHERAISHFQTDLHLAIQQRSDLTIPFYLRRFGTDPTNTFKFNDHDNNLRTLEPDLAFLLIRKQSNGRQIPLANFVELDRGTESMTVIADKLTKYKLWLEQHGQQTILNWYQNYDTNLPFYRILVITKHNDEHGDHLRQLAKWCTVALTVDPKLTISITTQALLDTYRQNNQEPIWYPIHRLKNIWHDAIHPLPKKQQVDAILANLKSWKTRYTFLPQSN